MLYYLVMTLFVLVCIILGFFVLLQQGKGDMGLGSIGGGSQTLFGGSGGQNFFEKTTWILGLLFMSMSFLFTLWQVSETRIGGYRKKAPESQAIETSNSNAAEPEAEQPAQQ